jgi:hypothetical protein
LLLRRSEGTRENLVSTGVAAPGTDALGEVQHGRRGRDQELPKMWRAEGEVQELWQTTWLISATSRTKTKMGLGDHQDLKKTKLGKSKTKQFIIYTLFSWHTEMDNPEIVGGL